MYKKYGGLFGIDNARGEPSKIGGHAISKI